MAFKKYRKLARRKKFSSHFKENLRFGIIAAVGFMIAFAWREPVLIILKNFVLKYFNPIEGMMTGILTAFAATLFGTLLILIVTRLLK
ncbi:MAG: DUF5654 family protein [archaeon]